MYRIKILAELNMYLSPIPDEIEMLRAIPFAAEQSLTDTDEAEQVALRRLYNMEGITVVYASVVDAQEL